MSDYLHPLGRTWTEKQRPQKEQKACCSQICEAKISKGYKDGRLNLLQAAAAAFFLINLIKAILSPGPPRPCSPEANQLAIKSGPASH